MKYLFNQGMVIGITVSFIVLCITSSIADVIDINNDDGREFNEKTTEIEGLYFLRDDDIGDPMNDEGTLKREVPIDNESTFCGMYVLFHFAEEGTYLETYPINSIYFHIWQKTPEYAFEGWEFDLGYSNTGIHNHYMNESIHINTSECISVVDNFRLVQAMQYTNPEIATFEGDEIFNSTVKSMGNGPRIRNNPNQYSFVILNLEDNVTLQEFDRDNDYLNDFDELFVYFTNPFSKDTDSDGATDYEEVKAASHGYKNSDPNDYTDTTDYRHVLLEIGLIAGGRGMTLAITNVGSHDASNVEWCITIEGGLIIFPRDVSGTIGLLTAGESIKVTMSVFGIGLGILTDAPVFNVSVITSNEYPVEDSVIAKVIGPFVLLQ